MDSSQEWTKPEGKQLLANAADEDEEEEDEEDPAPKKAKLSKGKVAAKGKGAGKAAPKARGSKKVKGCQGFYSMG